MLKVGDRVYIYRMKPAAKGGLVRNNDKGTIIRIGTDEIGRRYGYRYMTVKFDKPVNTSNRDIYSLEFFENKDDRKIGRIRDIGFLLYGRKCEKEDLWVNKNH